MKTSMLLAMALLACWLALPIAAQAQPYPWYDPQECSWAGTTYALLPLPIVCTGIGPEMREIMEAGGRVACTAPEDLTEARTEFRSSVYSYALCFLANLNYYLNQVLPRQ